MSDAQHGLPALGRRGGGWVAVQVALIGAIFLSAFAGRAWSSTLAPYAYALGGALIAIGGSLLVGGGLALGRALTPFPAPRSESSLRTTGVYALVRHPMYGGGIVVGVGWSILFATFVGLVLTVLLAVFAELKARREELWLEGAFSDYTEYRRRTPHRFIPLVWRRPGARDELVDDRPAAGGCQLRSIVADRPQEREELHGH